MTAILRILNVAINDSSNLTATFTENLTTNLVPANVSITSLTDNVPNSQILSVSVSGNALSITCQPLTPFAAYYLAFQNTPNNPFISVNGDAQIMQNGIANQVLITGPIQSDNPVLDYLQNFYSGNIYNVTDPTTLVSSYIQAIAVNFAQALYDIGQCKNENYLSFEVIDEIKVRGSGPFDHLNEESAYEVTRVGYGPTNFPVSTTFVFTDFPSFPVTLQRQIVTEMSKPSSNNLAGTFNVNTLTFNLEHSPVSKVDSIIFTLLTEHPVYTYNITTLGYQLLNSEYDQAYASSYLLLANNQVKINEAILEDPLFSLDQIFSIAIQYEYQELGIIVEPSSVDVYTTLQSVREVLPPLENIFNLQHAPITDASNNSPTIGGITFTNPNSNTGAPHPAFIMEIPFSLSALPAAPGIYCVDYPTGTVYVYGATSTNDGTGPSPPLATYYYQFTYVSEIDYVYDPTSSSLVALPLGNLINQPGTIAFDYQQVLIPNIDYVANVHVEAINEIVGNNLTALNSLTTQNSPITNVFQIYNQSTGEIYLLDRWYNNIVYFKYNKPPTITQETGENATFFTITNELLGINSTTTNSLNNRIFTIYLANNTIIAATQDCIASSINTSLVFTDGNIFVAEIWYNSEVSVSNNIDRLLVGEYTVDYINGIVYVAVSNTQNDNLGTASYKMNTIIPNFPYIVSVDNIYYRISLLNPINKQFSYISFSSDGIIPANLDISDEAFLNDTPASPYQIINGMVGAFVGNTFIPGVTNTIEFVRSVYEYNDLFNNEYPLNFANVSTSNNFNITVGSINNQVFETIQYNGTHYFVVLNQALTYLSPYITYTFNVVRSSDNQVLWNSSGTIVPGNPVVLILPGIGSPQTGQMVSVTSSFTINNVARVIVDYNKGDFFIDYTYVADTILVSYEYGDNVLDFRQNTNLPVGTTYYTSYNVGALRTALLANFGTLVNVPDLANFDLSLNRERYRDALSAALSSFVLGPTVAAIKNIGQIITHVEPEVIESTFQVWSLGNNLLTPAAIETTGSFQLLPAHFGDGVLMNQIGQTIVMPVNSNLRLEEGTFETWILPQWNGLDNDATLTFQIMKNGVPINPTQIFIGASGYHPLITANSFSLTKHNNVTGLPNTNKDGIYIYYGNDPSDLFQRWYIQLIDGYINPATNTYQFQIWSSGRFYDVRPIDGYVRPANMSTFTGTNKVSLTITPLAGNANINEGITFISDLEHYLLDFGMTENTNRLSIYKDISGYMNFRVFDKNGVSSTVSANVSTWQPNVAHMVAASWKLNTRNSRDEIHLFIDGLEVPNIINYGQKLQPYLHEKFRTVDPEEIVGLATRDIIGSHDLTTIQGTPSVSSSINFSQYNIYVGDTIFINETGFSSYLIEEINGQTLTLNANMPASLNANGNYSVNQTSYNVVSDITIAPNIALSTLSPLISGNDLITIQGSNQVYSLSTNFTAAGIVPGLMLRIDNSAFNIAYMIVQVEHYTLTIDAWPLGAPVSSTMDGYSYQIYSAIETELPGTKALYSDYSISSKQDGYCDGYLTNVLTIYNGVYENDLVLITTLGLNFQDVKESYYVWGDGYENVLMTTLPAPICLDQVNITKIILPNSRIIDGHQVSNDGYIFGDGYGNGLSQPSSFAYIDGIYGPQFGGRTIQATISGTNVNFTTPVQVMMNGISNGNTINETLSFTNYGTQSFINPFSSLNYVEVEAVPINPNKNALVIQLQEEYSITCPQFDQLTPIIRYSYPIGNGTNLSADGSDNLVTDSDHLFSEFDVGNYLMINSPPNVAGYYFIIGISSDRHSINIQPTYQSKYVPLPQFTNGIYQVLNTTAYRSGLQNGLFTLEVSQIPGLPYFLNQGFYQLEYDTYLSVKFAPLNNNLYIGTDYYGQQIATSILNQFTLSSIMMTDTRIGEVVPANTSTITKDFNSLTLPAANDNTLVLIDFSTFPFVNSANFYASTNNTYRHFQSEWTVNDNFGPSLVFLNTPLLVPNLGILNTQTQGTIEFWFSPLFDTANDPNYRFYFDAYGAVVEQATSVSNVAIKLSSPASQILSVTLSAGDPKVDYFAGGKLEIDTQHAIQEDTISVGNSMVTVSNPILQVITVAIIGDATGMDYFANGTIGGANKQTIYLGIPLPINNIEVLVTYQTTNNDNTMLNTQVIRLNKRLPAQNSVVTVKYIPLGLQGDRISIFKDPYGFINFAISASGTDYIIKAETRLARNTWHRLKASYQINGNIGSDNMMLFLDGYQYTDVFVGPNMTPGYFPSAIGSQVMDGYQFNDGYGSQIGDGYILVSSITFKDPINDLWIGTDYNQANPIFTLLNNLRISNIARPVYAPYGEPIDVNYSSNLSTVFPVTSDLYTTYLLNLTNETALITNFTTLVDRENGSFDFTVNLFDSFGIVASNPQIQQILTNLIQILKPASSVSYINIIE